MTVSASPRLWSLWVFGSAGHVAGRASVSVHFSDGLLLRVPRASLGGGAWRPVPLPSPHVKGACCQPGLPLMSTLSTCLRECVSSFPRQSLLQPRLHPSLPLKRADSALSPKGRVFAHAIVFCAGELSLLPHVCVYSTIYFLVSMWIYILYLGL